MLAWTAPAMADEEEEEPNACRIADPGFGDYHPWSSEPAQVRLLLPKTVLLSADNGFDLIIHFHGGNAVRKTIVGAAEGVFVAGVDLGAGSAAYERPFLNPQAFPSLLANIERAVADYTRNPRVHVRKLALTGWSAGYGAIRAILRSRHRDRVDSVALLDGLHTNYDETGPMGLQADQMSPFLRFAKLAAKGKKFMFVSHSSIVPPGYSSTTETTHFLVKNLGAKIQRVNAKDSPYLERYEQASRGGFVMRGYTGEQKGDHCAHLALMDRVVMSTLNQRWQTSGSPPARKDSGKRDGLAGNQPAKPARPVAGAKVSSSNDPRRSGAASTATLAGNRPG